MSDVKPTATVILTASPKLQTAVKTWQGAVNKADAAFDALRIEAKREASSRSIDKKGLTALLLPLIPDPARVSELVGFVFPASPTATEELQKAMAINAAAKVPKERVAKPVILALQRDKTGELTLDKALAAHAAERVARPARPQGNATTPAKAKTPEEQEKEIQTALSAAASLAKTYGYDRKDFDQTVEDWTARFLSELLPEEEAEKE